MRCSFAVTLIATLSAVVAAPLSQVASRYAPLGSAPLAKRNCNPMPSKVDPNIRDTIYRVVRQQTKDPKILKITMCTAITESLVNNLDCGDQDSLGIFQQRPSQGWGSPAQLQNPTYAINKFLEALMPVYNADRGAPVNVLAQRVQKAQAGDQYIHNLDFADQLIAQAAKSVGDGGDNNAPAPPPATTKTPNNGGAVNVGSGPTKSTDGGPQPTNGAQSDNGNNTDGSNVDGENCDDSLPPCDQYYTVQANDNCYKVSSKFNLTLDQFYKLNPEIDGACQNLYLNQQYCVAASDV